MLKTSQNHKKNKILKLLKFLMKMEEKLKDQILKKISKKSTQFHNSQIELRNDHFMTYFPIS